MYTLLQYRLRYQMIAACMVLFLWAVPVEAHGNVVNIALTCVASDSARPLAKICTAFLRYADGDPVLDAKFQLTARREGKLEPALGPVAFAPMDREGVYSARVTFPAYGHWRMKFQVISPGSGETEIVESLLPPAPGSVSGVPAQLQVTFQFGLADVRNIGLRVMHLLGAAGWFSSIVVVLVLLRLPGSQDRVQLLGRTAAIFPRAAGGSLLLLTITGLVSAIYNVPTRPPGLYEPANITRLPFGAAYLAVFQVKMLLTLVMLAATLALGIGLHRSYGRLVRTSTERSDEDGGSITTPLVRLATVNLLVGFAIFACVVVLGYMHVISHVAAAAGLR